jgi:hypothetical protein
MKNKILVIAISSLLLIGCGGSSDSSPADSNEPNVDDKSLATKIIFDKKYKDTVSVEDQVDLFQLETAKAEHEYYLYIKNLGDKNANYTTTYVAFSILDDEGEVTRGQVSTLLGENTFAFKAKNSGNLFVKFDSEYSIGHYDSRFEFEVKKGLEDGMVQDSTTYEYNNFKKLAYPIEKAIVYTATATRAIDPDDWYVLENVDSAKEHYLHLTNLGDRNENPTDTAVKCIIMDEEGDIQKINLTTPVKEKTYAFNTIKDGKVYIHFYTHLTGAIYGKMRYSFDVR